LHKRDTNLDTKDTKKLKLKQIIFDLDGTLIDSADSILFAFKGAFAQADIKPTKPLTKNIIGPPLKETLNVLSGTSDKHTIDLLADLFMQQYDTVGYIETVVFDQVNEMLVRLNQMPIDLYIATNKRIKPTMLILEHLGWLDYFKGIYALDEPSVMANNKTALIANLLKKHQLVPAETYYVGDTIGDKEAAENNTLYFSYANWGFGLKPQDDNTVTNFNEPNKMLDYFEGVI
jgi:phosphoglycolate phosphatase